MAYPHKRHRFQKFIVFLFAIVIILLVSYFVALPKIKTKAAGVVAEKLLESQITSDTSAIAGVNAQEILDAMNDTDRATVDQFTAPHLYFTDAVDTTNMTAFRKQMNEVSDRKITVSDILVYAASKALQKFPGINSSLVDGNIVTYKSTNIGVAVAGGRFCSC